MKTIAWIFASTLLVVGCNRDQRYGAERTSQRASEPTASEQTTGGAATQPGAPAQPASPQTGSVTVQPGYPQQPTTAPAAQPQPGQAGAQAGTPQAGQMGMTDQFETNADRDLGMRIRSSFGDDLGQKARDVQLHVAQGVVTLRGTVTDDDARDDVQEKAEDAVGKDKVVNLIRVAEPGSPGATEAPGGAAEPAAPAASAGERMESAGEQAAAKLKQKAGQAGAKMEETGEKLEQKGQQKSEEKKGAKGSAKEDQGDLELAPSEQYTGIHEKEAKGAKPGGAAEETMPQTGSKKVKGGTASDSWQTDSDKKLAQKVRSAYEKDARLKKTARDVSIDVSNGVITLRGEVADAQTSQALIDKARSFAGDEPVVDMVAVRSGQEGLQPSGAAPATPQGTGTGTQAQGMMSDDQLKQSVQSALQSDSQFGNLADQVQIEASSGIVTLRGTVPNDTAKNSFEQQAKSIAGENRVLNLLTVAPAMTSQPGGAMSPTAPGTGLQPGTAGQPGTMMQPGETTQPSYTTEFPSYTVVPPAKPRHVRTPGGMSVVAGGGAGGFLDGDLTDITKVAGNYGARVTYGTRAPIALEAAYIGSVQALDALGVDDDALLFGNGAEATVRGNFLKRGDWQPYLAAGAAWKRYSVRSDVNTSSVDEIDDVIEVPITAGLAWRKGGFVIDGRAGVRGAFDNELLGDQDLHTWTSQINLGLEF